MIASIEKTEDLKSLGGPLTREEVERTTGAPRQEQVHALVSALAAEASAAKRSRPLKAARADADMRLFLELVLEAIRSTLLIRYAPELRASLQSELGADNSPPSKNSMIPM